MILERKCAGKLELRIDCAGNCAGLLTNQCSCQVLSKICIDDRLANSYLFH